MLHNLLKDILFRMFYGRQVSPICCQWTVQTFCCDRQATPTQRQHIL